ncbi:MAG: hypothetical protein JKY52_17940 [Flavobacteriales bacterium]|nr:hypothetical protein [Flavobacteriales bacterium]
MKIHYVLLAMGLVAFSSCAKEQTCECEITEEESATGYSFMRSFDQDVSFKSKKKDAGGVCDDLEYTETYVNNGISTTISCECDLK